MQCLGEDGAPREIRTPDLLVRSQTLYPTELGAHKAAVMVPFEKQQFLR